MGGSSLDEHITDTRIKIMKETSKGQRRMEASSEGGKGPERTVDGWMEYFLGGKSDQRVGLTILPPSHAKLSEIWVSQPPETLTACQGLYRDCFTCTYQHCPHRAPMFVIILIMNSNYFLHNIK
jgi:hypothetical protein